MYITRSYSLADLKHWKDTYRLSWHSEMNKTPSSVPAGVHDYQTKFLIQDTAYRVHHFVNRCKYELIFLDVISQSYEI